MKLLRGTLKASHRNLNVLCVMMRSGEQVPIVTFKYKKGAKICSLLSSFNVPKDACILYILDAAIFLIYIEIIYFICVLN